MRNCVGVIITAGAIFALSVHALAAPDAAPSRMSGVRSLDDGLVLTITNFSGPQGDQVRAIVGEDLSNLSILRAVRTSAQPAGELDVNTIPNFETFNSGGTRYLVVGGTAPGANGALQVQVRLWDIQTQTALFGQQFTSPGSNIRRVAHVISDAIARRLTSKPSYFDTRIAYISNGPSGKTQLAAMDFDGAGETLLTTGMYRAADPNIFSGFAIAYSSERDGQDTAFLFALQTGKQKPIGHLAGATRMPSFSPDGRTVALVCDANGHSDICLIETTTDRLIRTISHSASDAYPHISPDGRSIVFESDLPGKKGIFVTDIQGNGLRRISGDNEELGMPTWSPDGSKIALVRRTPDGSHIAIIDVDGTHLREISSGKEDAAPSWAPNGEAILFTRVTPAGKQLWIVDVSTLREHAISTQQNASNASWSNIAP